MDLDDFEIYRSPVAHSARKSELIGLHQHEVPTPKKLCFDGYLCVGNARLYVQGVDLYDVSIEGYGDDEQPGITPYLRSELASQDDINDIWYTLRRPSANYRRFHNTFLWIAQLGKHVIDYLETQPARSVTLRSFRGDFARWLLPRFAKDKSFQAWHLAFRNQLDFRVGVHAYIDYIYNQAFNLSTSHHLLSHTLWGECMAKGMTSVKAQPQVVQKTLATHDVCEAFQSMYFRRNIQGFSPSGDVARRQELRKRKLGFMETPMKISHWKDPALQLYRDSPVMVGDVVALEPEKQDRKIWRNSEGQWLAYVHDIKARKHGVQQLLVIWLYRPYDTNIFKSKYPFQNELFFSDHCNCDQGMLLSTDVAGKHNVQWSPRNMPRSNLFIRQTYITRDSVFVTFKKEHKKCMCTKANGALSKEHRRGDTVYITRTVQGRKVLDPAIIWATDDSSKEVTVRKFLRLGRDCADLAAEAQRTHVAPNELVLTDQYVAVHASRIQRRCFVKFIQRHQLITLPSPYNRGGAGDRWFVSMSLAEAEGAQLMFLTHPGKCFREAPDSYSQTRILKGLSIFSGGGSLDRGIEEGGAVEFHTAVDFSPHAIHTQKANARNPSIRLYCGSVDDFLKAALLGENPDFIATVGEVEFLAAGSPCPGMSVFLPNYSGLKDTLTKIKGFSSLQQNILSQASLRNASHISTFCSFVDLYRPLYGVLENVVNMSSTRIGFEDENVLANVVSCLVSMGYQVNQYIMDAWSYGSAQQRSRILISIAAPGLTLVSRPWHTHRKPSMISNKSLGKLPNGERLSEREFYPTPFRSPSAKDVTSDLADIGTGNTQICISFPDHRLSSLPTVMYRSLLQRIPKSPPGCGYAQAIQLGLIPPMLQLKRNETGRSYTRIKEAGLIPCITTTLRIADARNGATLHWAQDRPISIMEARRAQNYPDNEPIIGTLAQQYEIIGNGVDRMVSLAFGLALCQALDQSPVASTMEINVESNESRLKNVENWDDEDGYLTDVTGSIISVQCPQKDGPYGQELMHSITPPNGYAKSSREMRRKRHHPAPKQPEPVFYEQSTRQTVTRNIHPVSTTTSFCQSNSKIFRSKRRRECEVTKAKEEELKSAKVENRSFSKRTKIIASTRSSSVLTGKSTTSTSNPETRATSLSSVSTRQTRHSGHAIEFAPVNWNKRPELERRRQIQGTGSYG